MWDVPSTEGVGRAGTGSHCSAKKTFWEGCSTSSSPPVDVSFYSSVEAAAFRRLNTDDMIWVLTSYSNLNFGASRASEEEVIAFENVIKKLDATGACKWYWDYELCGIR